MTSPMASSTLSSMVDAMVGPNNVDLVASSMASSMVSSMVDAMVGPINVDDCLFEAQKNS